MPMINIDMEDGEPEIMLTVSASNLDRFMQFMGRNNKIEKALIQLVEAKKHKELYGKDELYMNAKLEAWLAAEEALGI